MAVLDHCTQCFWQRLALPFELATRRWQLDDAAGLGPQLRESTLESTPAHREVIVERVVSQRVDYLQQLRLGHTDRGQPP
jgi:hypothetical protein